MPRLDRNTLEKLVDGLGLLFYVAMALAILTGIMGSAGWGFLILVLGSCALVARTTVEAWVGSQPAGAAGRVSRAD